MRFTLYSHFVIQEAMKKISNKKQMEKLVEIMKGNPKIAKGIYKKSQIQSYWEKYAEQLNSLGPPTRCPDKWLKVWTDFKFNIKKKLIHNNKEFKATGGGPNTLQIFSPLEETVVDLLSLKSSINPPGKEFGVNTNDENENNTTACNEYSAEPYATYEKENDENLVTPEAAKDVASGNDTTIGDDTNVNVVSQDTSHRRERIRSRKAKKQSLLNETTCQRLELLNRQTQSQEDFYKEIKSEVKETKDYVRGLYEYKKKSYYLKKDTSRELIKIKREKFEIFKKELEQERKDRITKLQLKKDILELEKMQKGIN